MRSYIHLGDRGGYVSPLPAYHLFLIHGFPAADHQAPGTISCDSSKCDERILAPVDEAIPGVLGF